MNPFRNLTFFTRFFDEILRLNLTRGLELGFPFLNLSAQVLDVVGEAMILWHALLVTTSYIGAMPRAGPRSDSNSFTFDRSQQWLSLIWDPCC
jgi:hypothetical protein